MLKLFLLLYADNIIIFTVSRWFAKGIRYLKRLMIQMEAYSKHKQNKSKSTIRRNLKYTDDGKKI